PGSSAPPYGDGDGGAPAPVNERAEDRRLVRGRRRRGGRSRGRRARYANPRGEGSLRRRRTDGPEPAERSDHATCLDQRCCVRGRSRRHRGDRRRAHGAFAGDERVARGGSDIARRPDSLLSGTRAALTIGMPHTVSCALVLATFTLVTQARAFCRASTGCGTDRETQCVPKMVGDCGIPLGWNGCVGYSIDERASKQVSLDGAEEAFRTAFT